MMRLLRIPLAALLLAWCHVAGAAFTAGSTWECRQTGSDANGGLFVAAWPLATPAAPGVAGSTTGGTVAAGTYYVVLTLTDPLQGESSKSAETSVTTTGTTSSITVTGPANPNSLGTTWNCYVGTTSGGPYFPQGTGLTLGSNRPVTATPPTTGVQPPGVNYSVQDAAQVAYTDIVINGTTNTNATSAAHPFTPALVGNVINITAGTGFTVQRAQITGVTAAGVATFDKSLGTLSSTGGTGNLGGAIVSPGLASGNAFAGAVCFVKYSATAYGMSASTGVASGSIVTNSDFKLIGYDTTRTWSNTDANRPTLQATANTLTLVGLQSGGSQFIANCILSANGHTAITGVNLNSSSIYARNCQATGCATGFTTQGTGDEFADCYATGCGTSFNGASAGCAINRCVSTSATALGFVLGAAGCVATDCVAYATAGTGFSLTAAGSGAANCLAHTTTGSGNGFNSNSQPVFLTNCISWGGSAVGYATGTKHPLSRYLNCAAGGNTTANLTATGTISALQVRGFIPLTADPCTNAAAGDFSLNNTAGGGALLRAAGVPASLPGVGTSSYPDVGPAQHRSPGHAR